MMAMRATLEIFFAFLPDTAPRPTKFQKGLRWYSCVNSVCDDRASAKLGNHTRTATHSHTHHHRKYTPPQSTAAHRHPSQQFLGGCTTTTAAAAATSAGTNASASATATTMPESTCCQRTMRCSTVEASIAWFQSLPAPFSDAGANIAILFDTAQYQHTTAQHSGQAQSVPKYVRIRC